MINARRTRAALALVVLLLATLLSACGGDDAPSASPGSPENPLALQEPDAPAAGGRSNEAATPVAGAGEQPGFRELVERQSSKPRTRFTPCNLVPAPQARAIVGAPIELPLEAPQGPTCIYRSRDGKSFVTLALQSVDFGRLKSQLQQRRRVEVSDRTGYCGHFGQDMLYVPLARDGVLSVGAPCPVAKQFAATAVKRLGR